MLEAQEMLRKWEARDPEVYSLWETMNGWVYEGFDVTYKEMCIRDSWNTAVSIFRCGRSCATPCA